MSMQAAQVQTIAEHSGFPSISGACRQIPKKEVRPNK
jgi:hypothetical protein